MDLCLSTVTTHESPLYSTDRHIPFVLSFDPGLQLTAVRSICITLLDHDEFTWFFPRGALDGDIEDSLKIDSVSFFGVFVSFRVKLKFFAISSEIVFDGDLGPVSIFAFCCGVSLDVFILVRVMV